MKKNNVTRIMGLLLSFLLMFSFAACSGRESDSSPRESNVEAIAESNIEETETDTTVNPYQKVIDYADAESFEFALNQGEDLVGKIVQFIVVAYHPDSAAGKDLWAGEHLNFVSEDDPGVDAGDTMTVTATRIVENMGSWFILYEKVDDAVVGDGTISKDSVPEEKKLEIVDSGYYFKNSSSDDTYMDFCALVYNPNEIYTANFPKVIVTVKDSEGTVLATEEQTGSFVLPGDTVTLCGMLSVVTANITEDMDISFDVEYDDSDSSSIYKYAKTSDFEITNLSEQKSDDVKITGEIKNNFSEDIDTVSLSAVFRKEGNIVYMFNTFLDDLASGQTKAFEIEPWGSVPDYDSVDVSAMEW